MNRRNLEERSGVGNKSPPSNSVGSSSRAVSSRSRVGKRPPPLDKKTPPYLFSASARDDKMNACSVVQQQQQHHHQEVAAAAAAAEINHVILSPSQEVGGYGNHDNNNNAIRAAKAAGGTAAGGGGGEKVNNGGGSEVNEWPRIYIPLSRKEKEEDFLAMKGTKLPQRPKKRPKTIDRILQVCIVWYSIFILLVIYSCQFLTLTMINGGFDPLPSLP